MESVEARIARVLKDEVELRPYDAAWPNMFKAERRNLLAIALPGLVGRVEHFGSTAVPGLTAKPVIDMLVEVSDLERTKSELVPLLEERGYDYLWRPTHGDDGEPFYCWFIKRDGRGERSHHLHMVESHFEHWDRLAFRDCLTERPKLASEYATLKRQLTADFPGDRIGYTQGKTEFVTRVTRLALEHNGSVRPRVPRRVRAIQALTSTYPRPLRLARGEVVATGKRDDEFPGWVWATSQEGGEGWAPERILKTDAAGRSVSVEDYTAAELDTKEGALLRVGRSVDGWLWCSCDNGRAGWIPEKSIEPM